MRYTIRLCKLKAVDEKKEIYISEKMLNITANDNEILTKKKVCGNSWPRVN